MQKLMADIEADASTARRTRSSFNLGEWLSEKLSSFSPRTLAWSASAAALAIVLQAGLLAGMFVNERQGGAGFKTASVAEQPGDQAGHRGADRLRPAGERRRDHQADADLQDGDRRRPDRRDVHGPLRDDRHAEGRAGRIIKQLQDEKTVRFVGQKSAD